MNPNPLDALKNFTVPFFTLYNLILKANGNVGIGTTSPSSYSGLANNLVVYEDGNAGITIASSISGNGSLFFADGTTGDEAYKGAVEYAHSTNKLMFKANSVTHMTIDPDGDVGIGTLSPSSPAGVGKFLHIADSSHAGIVLEDTGSTAYDIYSADGHLYFYSESASANTVAITNSGNVGIGTTNPTEDLHIAKSGNADLKVQSTTSGDDARIFIERVNQNGRAYLSFADTNNSYAWYTGLLRSSGDVYAIGESFLDNIYTQAAFTVSDGTGIVTCLIKSNTVTTGLTSTGSVHQPVGKFSVSRVMGPVGSTLNTIAIGITGRTVGSTTGLSTFPTLKRTGGSKTFEQTGAIIPEIRPT